VCLLVVLIYWLVTIIVCLLVVLIYWLVTITVCLLVVLNKALQVRKTDSIVRLRFLQVKLQARIGVSRAGDWKHVHIPSLRDDQTVGWLPSWLVRIDPAREVCRVNGVQSYADSGASSTDEQFQK